tara:strand:- start:89 stop:388 length:300 start_codon:yes stop_codon:yes gene_type:complete
MSTENKQQELNDRINLLLEVKKNLKNEYNKSVENVNRQIENNRTTLRRLLNKSKWYCELCNKSIDSRSKDKHLKSELHTKLSECKIKSDSEEEIINDLI